MVSGFCQAHRNEVIAQSDNKEPGRFSTLHERIDVCPAAYDAQQANRINLISIRATNLYVGLHLRRHVLNSSVNVTALRKKMTALDPQFDVHKPL